jgi:hypothetical protein
MAVAAASVTAGTVIAEHFLHALVFAICSASFENIPITFLCKMQVVVNQIYFIEVAVVTNFCVTFTRASNQIGVSLIYPTVFDSTMAFRT